MCVWKGDRKKERQIEEVDREREIKRDIERYQHMELNTTTVQIDDTKDSKKSRIIRTNPG